MTAWIDHDLERFRHLLGRMPMRQCLAPGASCPAPSAWDHGLACDEAWGLMFAEGSALGGQARRLGGRARFLSARRVSPQDWRVMAGLCAGHRARLLAAPCRDLRSLGDRDRPALFAMTYATLIRSVHAVLRRCAARERAYRQRVVKACYIGAVPCSATFEARANLEEAFAAHAFKTGFDQLWGRPDFGGLHLEVLRLGGAPAMATGGILPLGTAAGGFAGLVFSLVPHPEGLLLVLACLREDLEAARVILAEVREAAGASWHRLLYHLLDVPRTLLVAPAAAGEWDAGVRNGG